MNSSNVPPKAVIKLSVGKWHRPRTLQNPSLAHQPKRTLVLLTFSRPSMNAVHSYIAENKTLPIFPSWAFVAGDTRKQVSK